MSRAGTETAYAATRLKGVMTNFGYALPGSNSAIGLRAGHAMSGTDLAHGAITVSTCYHVHAR
eukprot:394058-Rhodomonas_salina.1